MFRVPVRWQMVLLTMVVAVLLYVDRACLSIAGESVRADLSLNKAELDWALGAFFWTYALGQVPAGWLGDRYGARGLLALYLCLWSLATGAAGLVTGLTGLLAARLACGLFESGAYPVAAGVVRRWVEPGRRGLASGLIAVGGRLGGVLAPPLTAYLMVRFAGGGESADTATSWRPVLMLYGGVGVAVAFVYWFCFRDDPARHPRVTPAELAAIRPAPPGDTPAADAALGPPPLRAMCRSVGLWANCFVQFVANFGWAFLITKLPSYLEEVHRTKIQTAGLVQAAPFLAGIVGLFLGGWLTDRCTAALGRRWGRVVPSVISRLAVALGFWLAMGVRGELEVALAFALVGFATDMATPAAWAYGVDVGGRHVGSVVGWANMWGNFGAALSPVVLGAISRMDPDDPAAGWRAAFLLCAGLQVLGAGVSLLMDSRTPIERPSGAA